MDDEEEEDNRNVTGMRFHGADTVIVISHRG